MIERKREPNKTVLIVEDDQDLRDVIAEILRSRGYTPICAGNGQEALDQSRALARPPALILLDLMMPVMDGWKFRARQREDPFLSHVPVVVITAHADAQQVAREMDAREGIAKPLQLATLLAVANRICASA